MSILSRPINNCKNLVDESEKYIEDATITQKRVSFQTLGCRLNQSETDILIRIFQINGFKIVHSSQPADICIINTCTVTANSDTKNRRAIRALNKQNPKAKIAVLGCYAQLNPEDISKIKGVNLILGNEDKVKILDYLKVIDSDQPTKIIRPKFNKNTFKTPIIPKLSNSNYKFQKKHERKEELISQDSQKKYSNPKNEIGKNDYLFKNQPRKNETIDYKQVLTISEKIEKTRSHLKIQDGCDFMCSFCVIPFARGRSRYREFYNLLEEAKNFADAGVREVVITGVNVGTYKEGDLNIVNVIDSINAIKGIERIRISSIEPTTVPKILYQYMKDSQHKLVPFFHLPIQSGSDNILKKMNRRYSAKAFSDEIFQAYESIPDLCIGTDVMVGFPEESESDFEKTLTLLKNLPLTYFHVFPFSERERTPAYKLKNKIPPGIKKMRSKLLRELSSEKRTTFYQRFLGKTRNVLFEAKINNSHYEGYTDNYIKVFLDDIDGTDYRNKIVPTKLYKLNGNSVLGKYLSN